VKLLLGGRLAEYRIARDVTLTQLTLIAAATVGRPIDLIVDADGNYLSVLTANGSIEHSVSIQLLGRGCPTSLSSGANGLAGR